MNNFDKENQSDIFTNMTDKTSRATRQKEKDEERKGAENTNSDFNAIMAELKAHRDEFKTLLKSQSASLKSQINEVHTSLEKLLDVKVKHLEHLIAENREELKAELDAKVNMLQQNLDIDIGQVSARMDRFEAKLTEAESCPANKFQSDVSVIIVGLPFTDGEIPRERVASLLAEVLQCDPVPEIVNAERTTPRGRGPGVIKVEFRTVQDKVAVLRLKKKLMDTEGFGRVFIQSAKSHTERLIDLNFRTILKELPAGKDYFLTGNGKLVKRDRQQERQNPGNSASLDSSGSPRRGPRSSSENESNHD